MGSIFRSEEMEKCQLIIQTDAAYRCMSDMGELGLAQFCDLNANMNAQQRKFVSEVRRCDEMERILKLFENKLKASKIAVVDTEDVPDAPLPKEMIDLEAQLERIETELKVVINNTDTLRKNYVELIEFKHILSTTQNFLDEQQRDIIEDAAAYGPDGLYVQSQHVRLEYMAGVILRERVPSFELLLWRACHGNVLLRKTDIELALGSDFAEEETQKTMFIVFFQGDKLKQRVKKICAGYHATMYPFPDTPAARSEMALSVSTRIEDLKIVLSQSQDHRQLILMSAAKNLKSWFIKVQKMKGIFHTLNCLNVDVTQKCFIAEMWCPKLYLKKIHETLDHANEKSGSTVPAILKVMESKEEHPTYYQVNKFTSAFQTIVEAYGVATYREVNPALYTIITFPFLFAVMFGDAGHGLLMTLFALWMVVYENPLKALNIRNEIWLVPFGGRYIILLMGLFSIYTGVIYNDIFSKTMNIFGSAWRNNYNESTLTTTVILQLNPATTEYEGYPYPLGLDPVWAISTNKLTFLNSYKMKLSVIIGLFHMLFGLMLSLVNHLHFKNWLNVVSEFIPQLVFILSIIGYLDSLIFWKWMTYDASVSHCAPSLLITIINMFLLSYPDDPDTECFERLAYDSQKTVQMTLVLLAVLMIPWMLLMKPLVLKNRNKKKMRQIEDKLKRDSTSSQQPLPGSSKSSESHDTEPEFEFGEIFVHQAIHTIEYCLGCISKTASYLRLWALSLAHAQLSEVLWSMTLGIGLTGSEDSKAVGGIMIWATFTAWAVLSVGILLVMEGLSAFLHALRLHWVEFQNNFYSGLGYAFAPFSFQAIFDAIEAEKME